MKVEIKINPDCTETEILITTDKIDESIENLIKTLQKNKADTITAFRNETVTILDTNEIYRIYCEYGKVFCTTKDNIYTLRHRLNILEETLGNKYFIRISRSEIINIKKVKNFDLSFTGTIMINFINNEKTYVSRRYIKKIKDYLGI